MGVTKRTLAVAFFFTLTTISSAQQLFVAAPNTLRLGAEETVAIFSHSGTKNVQVYLTDLPGERKQFSVNNVQVTPNAPKVVKVIVKPENIPDLGLTDKNAKHYVQLVVKSPGFEKKIKILVSPFSGYVFLQTDKPIYTPLQKVNIRLLSLDEDMAPDQQNFTLQIRNPQNTILENIPSKDLDIQSGIFHYNFDFPKRATLGEWSVVAFYGHKVPRNSTITFLLDEYVLPTYEVKVTVPEVILENAKTVTVAVSATYVYGNKVEGYATFRLFFKPPLGLGNQIHFGTKDGLQLVDGETEFTFNANEMKMNNKIGWFPNVLDGKLIVEAEVTEGATGHKETKTESSTVFAKSLYKITFERCLRDYKPGLVSVVEADIKYADGKPASGIATSIEVKDNTGRILNLRNPDSISTDSGKLIFLVETELQQKIITLTIKGGGSEGSHVMNAFQSTSNEYVALQRKDPGTSLKVGKKVAWTVFSHPKVTLPLSYIIVSQGKIVDQGSSIKQGENERVIEFVVNPEMVPSIRIVLFAHSGVQLLTDSIKLDVMDECKPKGKINIDLDFGKGQEAPFPGKVGKINIKGTSKTTVGILAVDKAVYVLRNKDLLTKEKLYQEMESHDLGCGPGGGIDSKTVLENAGIVIVTDGAVSATERPSYTCAEKKRKKREIFDEIHETFGEQLPHCCKLGTQHYSKKRECEDGAEIVETYDGGDLYEQELCAEMFLNCCSEAQALHISYLERNDTEDEMLNASGRKDEGFEFLDFLESDEDLLSGEDKATVRKDFRETWLFQIGIIGADGNLSIPVSLPDSITTWVVQAVGISPKNIGGGMCVADPQTVLAFQPIFMQVRMPYSVVTNEQIEIPVTLFNYSPRKQQVTLYFYGVQDLCSEAQPQERSRLKKLTVFENSATSTSFAMVPLKAKQYSIKFVALSSTGSADVVMKVLNVVPEGVPREEDIVITIDPANSQKRKRRNVEINPKYESRYDEENNQQTTIVNLMADVEYIPGTESCLITAIGDKFGDTIHTTLENPDRLLRLPGGCGEQNMAYLAPTLYTLHYLKVTGKLTAVQEKNAYGFIRQGYQNQQAFRKVDGSYAAYLTTPSSTWLTAFVAKVFCQAEKYVFIDENVICTALNWLSSRQENDGSFVEKQLVYHREMMGGVLGSIPLTAFVLLAFEKCKCSTNNMAIPKKKALDYLVKNIPQLVDYYQLSIATYSLAVAAPENALEHNKRLLALSRHNEDQNERYWGDGKSGRSVEASSYALQTQLILGDIDVSTSIVNWMNKQRQIGGAFWSSQDTVAAIEALSEYAIRARDADVNLVCNLTSTNDRTFIETLEFRKDNARVLQTREISKFGGKIAIEAEGTGVSNIGFKLRYNVPVSPDKLCKFNLSIDVKEYDEEKKLLPRDLVRNLENGRKGGVKKLKEFVLNVTICAKYLSDKDTNMAIVDAGILTGYKVNENDLKALVTNRDLPISYYEKSGRNVLLYFDQIYHSKTTCFWYRMTREFLVSELESAMIRVYDYYEPAEACSEFYSPDQTNARIKKDCTGTTKVVCTCAEGGCSPAEPFAEAMALASTAKQRQMLQQIACNKHDFFWKVSVVRKEKGKTGFLKYTMKVNSVLKEGVEKAKNLVGEERKFTARGNCNSSDLVEGKTYLIMGMDQEAVREEPERMYYIDKKTRIHKIVNSGDRKIPRKIRDLQKNFSYLERLFKERKGCID